MSYHSTGYRGLGQDDLTHDPNEAAASAMEAAMEPDPNAAMLKFSAPKAQPTPAYNYNVPTTPTPTKPKVASTYVAPRAAPAVTYVPPPPAPTIKPWMWWVGGGAIVVAVLVLAKH